MTLLRLAKKLARDVPSPLSSYLVPRNSNTSQYQMYADRQYSRSKTGALWLTGWYYATSGSYHFAELDAYFTIRREKLAASFNVALKCAWQEYPSCNIPIS
jgi:hypothetical protein